MSTYDDHLLAQAVNNVSPKLVDGGKKLRGPNATWDFVYQVWVEKALIQTAQLPAMLEIERQNYLRQQKLLRDVGNKGKYTDSYGWSKGREYKVTFSLTPTTYNYFANVVGPLLGYDKQIWADDSRMWRFIKKLTLDADKVKISKFTEGITKRLRRESHKRIMGVVSGPEIKSTS